MTPTEALTIRRTYNYWRRGFANDLTCTPREIGKAIKVAIQVLLEKKMDEDTGDAAGR
jgi:hypothetical protein